MKTLIIKFTFAMLCLSGALQAQVPDTAAWCPPGATWVYRKTCNFCASFDKYVYEKDTMLKGQTVKKFNHFAVSYAYINPIQGRVESWVDAQFKYLSNDSMYFYVASIDSFLYEYSFDAIVGDSFIVSNPEAVCYSNTVNPTDTLQVFQISPFTYQNLTFQIAYVGSSTAPHTWEIGNIIKNIGSAVCPYPTIVFDTLCTDPYPNYIGLNCYSDSLRGKLVMNGNAYLCDDLLPINQIPAPQNAGIDNYLQVYPNPASTQLWLSYTGQGILDYELYDVMGRTLQQGRMADDYSLDIQALGKGAYYLLLRNEKNQLYHAKFIKL